MSVALSPSRTPLTHPPLGTPPLILVVEDEASTATTMHYKLTLEGYRTRMAHDAPSALRELLREPIPDLVLLDLLLPDLPGAELCALIRQKPACRHVPVILLAPRAGEQERIAGLEAGAVDILVQPYSIRELMLRIRIGLRRGCATANTTSAPTEILRVGDLQLDKERHRVLLGNDPLPLSVTEFRLLHLMMVRAGRVLGRETLLGAIWGMRASIQSNTVDSHIKELRKKLGPLRNCIETVRGVGYRFNANQVQHHRT